MFYIFKKAILDWESVTDLIVEREKYIFDLETFERTASDPNRYFVNGFLKERPLKR